MGITKEQLIDAISQVKYYVDNKNENSINNGKSAYDIAVENGFDGTEEEWLESLKGETGITPHIGENGNWFIGYEDTGILADCSNNCDINLENYYNKTEVDNLIPNNINLIETNLSIENANGEKISIDLQPLLDRIVDGNSMTF